MARDNKATVVLGHQTRTYKGQEQEAFTGVLKIGGKSVLLTISADGGHPREYESKKDGTPLIYLNAIDLGKTSQRKRRNEL